MSCEIQLTATFQDISKFLQQTNYSSSDNENEVSKNSLSDYKIAISPTGEVIVFAKSSWLLICGSKYNLNNEGAKLIYSPNWHGHLQCKHGEKVTSLLCLPFFFYGKSIQGGADWTCIVVGFSTGCVRFYTETMQEIAWNVLHEEPVAEIKCYSPSIMQQGKTLKQDNNDIYVLYKTVICIFNGPNLSQILLNRRSQLAKGVKETTEINECTQLDFKKYLFTNQEIISDACFLGQSLVSTYNTFDHLVTASIVGGFECNYRPSPPQTSLIIASGKKPFVGFHYTLESSNSPVLADVALAVANKIKSSVTANLTDWFGFGSKKSSSSEKQKETSYEHVEHLNCRFGLCDLRRHGQSIILSPDGAFSAVSDSLGRVTLIENATGIAQRLWKGFRDAQCGFLLVQEDIQKAKHKNLPKSPLRHGLFIVIYTPRKGLIEIFNTQSGRRVTSFQVTKLGRLIYNPRGYIVPNVSSGNSTAHRNEVVFVTEEGLMEFFVPFHCALAEENSKMFRDLHILKKIKLLLKTESSTSVLNEELEKCANELKMDEVRFQAVELLLSSRNISVEVFKKILSIFLEEFRSEDKPETTPQKIKIFSELLCDLLSFYDYLKKSHDFSCNDDIAENSVLNADSLHEDLRTSEKELDITLKFINQIKEIEEMKTIKTSKVTFQENKSDELAKFLSCFDFALFLSELEKQEEGVFKSLKLRLKKNVKEEKLIKFSELVFKGILHSVDKLNEWIVNTKACFLEPIDLAQCLLSYWYTENVHDNLSNQEVKNFVKILKGICSLNDPNVVCVEYNEESPWWSHLRSHVSSSPSTIRGLLAALVCRSVTIYIEQEKEIVCKKGKKHKTKKILYLTFFRLYLPSTYGIWIDILKTLKPTSSGSLQGEWETISKDTCQWDIIITQLEDVALLNAILNLSFKNMVRRNVFPEIPFDFKYQCLSSIQMNGNGRVSELVAKWLAQFGFDSSVFINKNDVEFSNENVQTDAEEEDKRAAKCYLVEELNKANNARDDKENCTLPLHYLELLKSRFPYSLTTSSLLSNLCWEYTAYWSEHVENLDYLNAALKCLNIVPATKIKYGICFLSWTTYLQHKLESLAKMVNRVGKVPKDKLCTQEIGLRNDQVPQFLRLIMDYLNIMLQVIEDENNIDFKINLEAVWQNSVGAPASSLISIALSQPNVDRDAVILVFQLTISLLLISGLDIKLPKLFWKLFENIDPSNFSLSKKVSNAHLQSATSEKSRCQFLKKAIAEAAQTIQVVERIPEVSSTVVSEDEILPSTKLNVDEYKKWMQLCFDLALDWNISIDELRKHQICELYSNGFDRLAEEIIPSVSDKEILGSQLLVLVGKRLKYLIQDTMELTDHLANLSSNVSEWLKCLDLENFRCQNNSFEDIDVMTSYVIKLLPDGHSDQTLALSIIESISFLKLNSPEKFQT